ncbi:MAG: ankyrin repeat domain-containing protein [Polaromonas sp.]|nr:ankyrin repeat domain-containing protein [Polaromonas sp.]
MSDHRDDVPGPGNGPEDDLARRYQEAGALDASRPSPAVRANVRAHAAALQAARASGEQVPPALQQRPAANQSRWKLSMLATFAIVAMSGLLVLQFDRGTPVEQDAAFGLPAPARPPAPAAEKAKMPDATPAQKARPQAARPAATDDATGHRATPANPAAAESPLLAEAAASTDSAGPATTARARAARPASEKASAERAATGASQESTGRAAPAPVVPAPPPAAPQAMPAPALVPAPPVVAAAPLRPAPSPSPSGLPVPAQAPTARAEAPAPMDSSTQNASPSRGAADMAASSSAPAARSILRASPPASVLHTAARIGDLAEVERLLMASGGTSLNSPDSAGRTPLMLAALHGHVAIVRRLLAAGANPALVDRDGRNARALALGAGHADIAALIAAGS